MLPSDWARIGIRRQFRAKAEKERYLCMEGYRDISLPAEERARLLLAEMSDEEKLAQLVGFLPAEENPKAMEKQFPYGVGHISTLEMRRLTSLEAAAHFQKNIQQKAMELSPHQIPAIFHMEGLSGAFLRQAPSFPAGVARGASWDDKLEKRIGEIVSRQECCVGITQTLAPVLDVARDPRLGRAGESYSEDPTLVAAMGTAFAAGIQQGETAGRRSMATAKHFLGSHAVQGGIHGTNCDIPERRLKEIYAKPFQAAITEAGLMGVMPCYSSIDGEPVSSSEKLLTGWLREEMGFEGLVVSDYGAIENIHKVQHVGESPAEAGVLALAAGIDVELPNPCCFQEEFLIRVRQDDTLRERFDQSVLRVLAMKFRMGLFEHPFSLEGSELLEAFCKKEDDEIALQSAREGIVLLKNDGILPIGEHIRRIAVIGPHGDHANAFFGDYTHVSFVAALLAAVNSIAGIGESGTKGNSRAVMIPGTEVQSDETEEFKNLVKLLKPDMKSLYGELKSALGGVEILYAHGYQVAGADESEFDGALELVAQCDMAILTIGGRYASCSVATMGEGVDACNINLPKCQDRFIEEASRLGKPLVGIHFGGRPISSDAADRYLNAIVEAWELSEKGPHAIVEALIGMYNPSGKLPVTVLYSAGQIPLAYNHAHGSAWHQAESIGFNNYVDMPHEPRYEFGFGLSYTQYRYDDLRLDKKEAKGRDIVRISLKLTNIGTVSGTEIVQLYCSDRYASVGRPVKELVGFARVPLKPQETKRVSFALGISQLAFVDRTMRWKIEAGEILVQVGASSEDIRLEDSFRIIEDAYVETAKRAFYAAQ